MEKGKGNVQGADWKAPHKRILISLDSESSFICSLGGNKFTDIVCLFLFWEETEQEPFGGKKSSSKDCEKCMLGFLAFYLLKYIMRLKGQRTVYVCVRVCMSACVQDTEN